MIRISRIFCFSIVCLCIPSALAGSLDDFERSAKDTNDHQHDTKPTREKYDNDDDTPDVMEDFVWEMLKITGTAIVAGGINSYEKALHTGEHPIDLPLTVEPLKPKRLGEKHIPFLRLDAAYGDMTNAITLTDFGVELGYGPISAAYQKSRFMESAPKDKLTWSSTFLNYRASILDHLQIDLGYGKFSLDGNDSTSEMGERFGIGWSQQNGMGFEYEIGTTHGDELKIRDQKVDLLYSFDFISLKAGYRHIKAGDEIIEGPFAGFEIHI